MAGQRQFSREAKPNGSIREDPHSLNLIKNGLVKINAFVFGGIIRHFHAPRDILRWHRRKARGGFAVAQDNDGFTFLRAGDHFAEVFFDFGHGGLHGHNYDHFFDFGKGDKRLAR
jgi:hypothetical protein